MSRAVAVLLAGCLAGCSSSERTLGPPAPSDCVVTRQPDRPGLNIELGAVYGGNGVWVCSSALAFVVGSGVGIYDGTHWKAALLGFDSSAANAVWGTSGHNVWAVGNYGLVSHFDGTSWHSQHLAFASVLRSVWGSGPSDVYAVGTDNTGQEAIMHFNGTSWSEIRQVGASALFSVWGSGPNDVWAVGVGGLGIFVVHGSASSGFTRDPISGSTAGALYGVWADSPTDVWAVGDQIVLHRTSSGWTPILTGEQLRTVWGRSSTEVYMAAQSGAILKYGSGGLVYQVPPGGALGVQGSPTAISGVGDLTVAVGTSAIYQRTTGAWTPYQPGSMAAIWLSDDTHGWAVGDGGRLVQGTGSGWTDVTPVSASALTAVWGSGISNVYAVGADGTVLRNTGGSWGSVASSAHDSLNGVWGSSASDVWIVGGGGQILHGSGTTFTASSSGTTQHLRGVSGTGPSDVWVVGDGGTIVHYNGSAWSPTPSGVTVPLVAVWMNNPTDGWAVGPYNGIPPTCQFGECNPTTPVYLHWDGTMWSSVNAPGAPLALWFQSPTNGWAAGGTIYQYNGTTFGLPVFGAIGANLRGVYGTADGNVYFVGDVGSIYRYEP
jgi:hypothetical protein